MEGVCDMTVEAVRTAMGEPVMCDAAMQDVKKPKESGLQQDARVEKGNLGEIPISVHSPDAPCTNLVLLPMNCNPQRVPNKSLKM